MDFCILLASVAEIVSLEGFIVVQRPRSEDVHAMPWAVVASRGSEADAVVAQFPFYDDAMLFAELCEIAARKERRGAAGGEQ